ncbi:alkyl sulfatase dimerization domain-containing protein [Rhabdothermincola sp.]|uniref:alkyl sulfatase dimerization domain-containing protein n=1 Tax=Rhabdothermincola sp. TaxID=2820405 RepID=UPI002FE049A4
MTDLLALSARVIDEGDHDAAGPAARVTFELSELTPGLAMVESFSNVVAFGTGEGLVLFDTSMPQFAGAVVEALRRWSNDPVRTIVYTHGHVDHVGGARTLLEEAAARGERRPEVVAHEAVPTRFRRYDLTNGYNALINDRQFRRAGVFDRQAAQPRFPQRWVEPSVTYSDQLDLRVGDLQFELRHDRGETDDHTWAWIPSHRAVCVGDFIIWAFPNAGNPQKVQRYPLEWARALRRIQALEPELLLPAHGLPVGGRERVSRVLDDTASALESLVAQTLDLMNAGATLDTIIHTVTLPDELLARPYLRPVYDDPQFVVRNVWRLYGGWWDGDPSRLKPAPDRDVACELVHLAGGASQVTGRALALAEAGDARLASHLVELAVRAAPDDPGVHDVRAEVYRRRRSEERSLMARSIFDAAARESEQRGGER